MTPMDRGQAHTLEAFTAALLLVAGVLFALQATAVTPLSASTSNQYIENQQRTLANDLLATSAENGTLEEAIVYWNTTAGGFEGANDDGFYTAGGPPNAFGRLLNETFHEDRIAFNVYVTHRVADGFDREPMVFMGAPSDNAVSASRTVTLFNDTQLTGPSSGETVSTAAANGEFYASDVQPGGELFNVVEVQIVVWRM